MGYYIHFCRCDPFGDHSTRGHFVVANLPFCRHQLAHPLLLPLHALYTAADQALGAHERTSLFGIITLIRLSNRRERIFYYTVDKKQKKCDIIVRN